MKRRFVFVMVAVVMIVLAVRDIPLGIHLARIERERVITRLERDAYVLAGRLTEPAAGGLEATEVARELEEFVRRNSTDVVVVDSSGRLLGASDSGQTLGETYLNRPEIVAGLLGEFRSGTRESATLGEAIVYAAVPVLVDGTPAAVVRLSNPETSIDELVGRQVRGLVLGAVVSVLIGVIAALLLAQVLTRPVLALRDAVRKFSGGQARTEVPLAGPPEMRQLAQDFNEMSARVARMLDRQRNFAGDAAHQLRTPLTALRIRLESASDAMQHDARTAPEHIEAALRETERLVTLTEQMLLLARSEGVALKLSEFDLGRLVRMLADEWSAFADEVSVKLSVEGPHSLVVASSDIAWREILGNYIDNAIAHSRVDSQVVIILSATPTGAEVTVRDFGLGMSAKDRERAFDRFWRGSSEAGGTGSGLGLAIVAQLAVAAAIVVELRESPSGGIDAVARSARMTTPVR